MTVKNAASPILGFTGYLEHSSLMRTKARLFIAYDAYGNLTDYNASWWGDFNYSYDNSGRRVAKTDPWGDRRRSISTTDQT